VNKLNPNHPVSQEIDDDFMSKVLAVVVMKCGGRVEITAEEVREYSVNAQTLVTHIHPRSVELRLVGDEEASAILREHGGLPA
jgi:hypothetical protein